MDPFIAEIRLFPFDYAPQNGGWLPCDGSQVSIAIYTPLYAVIGTTYGGDGQTTFGLPDLRGRVPIGTGPTNGDGPLRTLGEQGGAPVVTLTQQQLPTHTHTWGATAGPATSGTPGPTAALGGEASTPAYLTGAIEGLEPFSPAAVGPFGGHGPHNNVQPFLALNFCIAYEGVFPPHG